MIDAPADAPYAVETHRSLASTNDRARELAAAGEADVAVLADEQTGGRGRRGRSWTGPAGGIYCSVLRRPSVAPDVGPAFTLAAAVAVVDACDPLDVDPGIKWPNDVRVAGDKLAGVLTETATAGDDLAWAVTGIGVNANVDDGRLPDRATSLRATAGDVDRSAFVERLLVAFDDLATRPREALDRWRDDATTLGRRVRVETADGAVVGSAVDVEFPGTLVIETDAGVERVSAGDCEHLRSV